MMYGSWDMERNRHNFLSFWLFFPLLPPYGPRKSKFSKKWKKHLKILSFYKHKWQSYDVWFLRYGVQQTEFFVILDHFLPFHLPNNPKNQNLEKMKKTPGNIIILHKCTITDNYITYGSWDMKHDRQNFLSFWTIFCTFIPLTTQKIKILKKWKTPGDIHKWTINDNHMVYISWDMNPDGQNFLSFQTVFCHFTPLTTQKIKIWKEILSLYTCKP